VNLRWELLAYSLPGGLRLLGRGVCFLTGNTARRPGFGAPVMMIPFTSSSTQLI
jgi:hypothetical protein